MQERHYQHLRNLTKLRDDAINMTHHIDTLYEDFLRMSDEDKDTIIENTQVVCDKPTQSLKDSTAETPIDIKTEVKYSTGF